AGAVGETGSATIAIALLASALTQSGRARTVGGSSGKSWELRMAVASAKSTRAAYVPAAMPSASVVRTTSAVDTATSKDTVRGSAHGDFMRRSGSVAAVPARAPHRQRVARATRLDRRDVVPRALRDGRVVPALVADPTRTGRSVPVRTRPVTVRDSIPVVDRRSVRVRLRTRGGCPVATRERRTGRSDTHGRGHRQGERDALTPHLPAQLRSFPSVRRLSPPSRR